MAPCVLCDRKALCIREGHMVPSIPWDLSLNPLDPWDRRVPRLQSGPGVPWARDIRAVLAIPRTLGDSCC